MTTPRKSDKTIWVALDCEKSLAIQIADAIGDHPAVRGFKLNRLVDAENFCRRKEEQALFASLTRFGKDLWADMKLVDIPATVEARAAVYAQSGYFRYLTVMANGGLEMMEAAIKGGGDQLNIIAVTVLTSISPTECVALTGKNPQEMVPQLANLAFDAGVRHIVCSGQEVRTFSGDNRLKQLQAFIPAISPAWTLGDQVDQKRTSTPQFALANGAQALVIGRAIINAKDPLEAVQKTADEIDAIE